MTILKNAEALDLDVAGHDPAFVCDCQVIAAPHVHKAKAEKGKR